MTHDEAAKVLEAIEHALRMGFAPADILDENSPIRDGIRTALSAKPEAVACDWKEAIAYAYASGYERAHDRTVEGCYSTDSTGVAFEWIDDNEAVLLQMIAPPPAQSIDDELHKIGYREGYDEAVQDIDVLTGGDGEYRYCTDHDPDRHTPDAEAMKARIKQRFDELPCSAQSDEVEACLSELVMALDGAFISTWQSTADWQKQLDQARALLARREAKS